ncbi:hypothetical protein FDUTEX481_02923 [Tolypothrix sp. PCC 7601]|nr:hypothetical protein FDUTEX481_02923 [Tolypothrix sp. PCC 7601]
MPLVLLLSGQIGEMLVFLSFWVKKSKLSWTTTSMQKIVVFDTIYRLGEPRRKR